MQVGREEEKRVTAGPENKKTNGKCWRSAPNMMDQTQPEITESSSDCGDYNSWNVLRGLWNSKGLTGTLKALNERY